MVVLETCLWLSIKFSNDFTPFVWSQRILLAIDLVMLRLSDKSYCPTITGTHYFKITTPFRFIFLRNAYKCHLRVLKRYRLWVLGGNESNSFAISSHGQEGVSCDPNTRLIKLSLSLSHRNQTFRIILTTTVKLCFHNWGASIFFHNI